MLHFTQKIDATIGRIFGLHGQLLGKYPWFGIIIPLIFAISLGFGALRFDELNNIRQFSADNSQSHYENAVIEEFLQEKGTLYTMWIILLPKLDGESVLEPRSLNESKHFANFLRNGIKIEQMGRNFTFADVCGSYCNLNQPLSIFFAAYGKKIAHNNRNFRFKYPMIEIFGESLYIGNGLYGVSTDDNQNIESAEMILLHYFAIADGTSNDILKEWDKKVTEKVKNMNENHIRALMSSEDLMHAEVRRSGISMAPYLVGSFVVVITFTALTSVRSEWHRSKLFESVAGVCGPLIATIGSFGFLLLLGIKYQPIVTITVFLIVAIGVDDIFLMLHAWDRTNPTLSVVDRMQKTLAESGPSITITSLTNALSFGVGILSQTPAIRTFCIYTTTAIVFSYMFQLTFFSGILALGGRREARGTSQSIPNLLSEKMSQKLTSVKERFLTFWSKFLITWLVRIFVMLLLIVYWAIAIYGFTKIHVEITAKKLVMADSPLVEYYNTVRQVWAETQQLTVIVNNPGDLRTKKQQQRIYSLVKDFEAASHSAGKKSTEFWLQDYWSYLMFFRIRTFEYTELPEFLRGHAAKHLSAHLRLNNKGCNQNHPSCIRSFLFTTGFKNAVNYSFRKQLLDEWRGICQNHSYLNVSVFEYYSHFADQIDSIKETTKTTIIIALLCMAIVCLVFIPSLISVLCAAVCVMSINLGVVGFVTLWGVDLDPISMASLLMSIGLSVDFTAHMSYHYYKGKNETPQERLIRAYDSIGWPTLQSGITTFLAAVIVYFHNSYISMVFIKTGILVITLGLLHGLFILPVGLAALPFQK